MIRQVICKIMLYNPMYLDTIIIKDKYVSLWNFSSPNPLRWDKVS